MKKAEFATLEVGDTIVIGTKNTLDKGRYSELLSTIVLATGKYQTIHGTCGACVIERETGEDTVVVPYPIKQSYRETNIIPRPITASQVLMRLSEYEPIIAAVEADKARHQAMQDEYAAEKERLENEVASFFKGNPESHWSSRYKGNGVYVQTLTFEYSIDELRTILPKKQAAALEKLQNLKAPVC